MDANFRKLKCRRFPSIKQLEKKQVNYSAYTLKYAAANLNIRVSCNTIAI
jgi:hypothetical protein